MSEIAIVLRADERRLFRVERQLLKKLRQDLHAQGVDADTALQALQNPAVEVDWDAEQRNLKRRGRH
jgi:hypothetical protein